MKFIPTQPVCIINSPIADASGQTGIVVKYLPDTDGYSVRIEAQNRTIFCHEHELEAV